MAREGTWYLDNIGGRTKPEGFCTYTCWPGICHFFQGAFLETNWCHKQGHGTGPGPGPRLMGKGPSHNTGTPIFLRGMGGRARRMWKGMLETYTWISTLFGLVQIHANKYPRSCGFIDIIIITATITIAIIITIVIIIVQSIAVCSGLSILIAACRSNDKCNEVAGSC